MAARFSFVLYVLERERERNRGSSRNPNDPGAVLGDLGDVLRDERGDYVDRDVESEDSARNAKNAQGQRSLIQSRTAIGCSSR